MKYQIIKTQVGANQFSYTVHLVDGPKDVGIQLGRLCHAIGNQFRKHYSHNSMLHEDYEYCWDTQEAAEQFIQDHIEWKTKGEPEWRNSPDNPNNWKPELIKEIKAQHKEVAP